jgi:hypothetical protein
MFLASELLGSSLPRQDILPYSHQPTFRALRESASNCRLCEILYQGRRNPFRDDEGLVKFMNTSYLPKGHFDINLGEDLMCKIFAVAVPHDWGT